MKKIFNEEQIALIAYEACKNRKSLARYDDRALELCYL